MQPVQIRQSFGEKEKGIDFTEFDLHSSFSRYLT